MLVTEPTLEELALEGQRLRILRDQVASTSVILQSMMLTETLEGKVRRMSEDEYIASLTPTHRTSYENLKLHLSKNKNN